MLKKSITYETFNGESVTEDFYFHLTKAELVEMEMSQEGGLAETLKRIIETQDAKEIIREFKNILRRSYGKKSPDGRRFIKNDQLWEEFESSEAYSVLFMDLVTDSDAAAEFVRRVIPQSLSGEAILSVVPKEAEPSEEPTENPMNPEPRKLSQLELTEMDADELKSGLASGRYIL